MNRNQNDDQRDRTRIFISHRHEDAATARVIKETLEDWQTPWEGNNQVFNSSSPRSGVAVGDDIRVDLRRRLLEANLVILVFTFSDRDWSWPWHEVGLADSLEEEEHKRIVIFQCCDDRPKLLGHHRRVRVEPEDIEKFTREYFTLKGFFPGIPDAFQAKMPERAIAELSQDFYQRLQEVIPRSPSRLNAPLILKDDLLAQEHRGEGGLLTDPGDVVIRSAQPLERDYEFAVRVMSNLKARVLYRYYFSKGQSFRHIGLLVQSLAVAGIEDLRSSSGRKEKMERHGEEVRKNLDVLQRYVNIYFVTDRSPDEFCAYNVEDRDSAVYYLRYRLGDSDGMLRLYERDDAINAMRRFNALRADDADGPGERIFKSSTQVRLSDDGEARFLGQLKQGILDYFPTELQADAEAACFGVAD